MGPADGVPVLYFHGAAGSPMDREATAPLLGEWGVRWFAVQRPGFGASCRRPGRTLAQWPSDLATLADALELDELRIVGVSAGAPYALCAAAALGDRVRAVAAVVPMCPPRPGAVRPALARLPRAHHILDDVLPLLAPWPFALSAVRAEVQVWHGARDRIVPVAGAARLAGALPAARLTVCEREGHFFFRRRIADVLAGLISTEGRRSPMVCA